MNSFINLWILFTFSKYILALKNKPEQAQLAVRVGIAVAKSDGDFDETEMANAREIIEALGFTTSEFGL